MRAFFAAFFAPSPGPHTCEFRESDALAFALATIHQGRKDYPQPRCVHCGKSANLPIYN